MDELIVSELKKWLEKNKEQDTPRPPLLVVLGPTASGKTALSLHFAHALGNEHTSPLQVEIISADSRQIYREIDIGSDKIPLTLTATPYGEFMCYDGIPHHMIDIVSPDQVYTMGDFKRDAQQKITEISGRGHLPMLVGGTGLYIRAITDNYDLPPVEPNHELRRKLLSMKKDDLYRLLQEKDPAVAAKIHPNNIVYVTRAVEIIEAATLSRESADVSPRDDGEISSPLPSRNLPPKYDVFTIGITRPREQLYARINARVDDQFARGLAQESLNLIKKYGAPAGDSGTPALPPSLTSLGVKEFLPYITGNATLEQVKQSIKSATRNYAKRQITWFKKDKNVHWINPEEA